MQTQDYTKEDRPAFSIQKQLLENKIAAFRQEGFQHEMQIIYLGAQKGEDAADTRKIKDLQAGAKRSADNAYASARRLKEVLDDVERQIADEKATAPAAEE